MFHAKLIKTIVLASAFTIVCISSASPYDLKPLNASKQHSAEQINHLNTITMIFQPDCSWCKKQGKTLAKIFKQCQSSLQVNLVGTKGKKRHLQKELKHYHEKIPAFMADRKFLRKIGGYQASPTTLFFDNNGELIAKKRGFIPENNLADAIKLLSQGECKI